MDQFEIIWILVTVIGALNYGLNAYQKGFRRRLKWDVIFLLEYSYVSSLVFDCGALLALDKE